MDWDFFIAGAITVGAVIVSELIITRVVNA